MTTSKSHTTAGQADIRVAQNSSYLLLSQVVTKLASFGGVILLARLLGVSDFGVYALALAVIGIIGIFAELGLDQLAIREIARDQNNIGEYLSNSILIKLSLSAVALLATAAVLSLADIATGSRTVIMVFIIALLPLGILHSMVAVFTGIERMSYTALSNIISEFIRLALAVGVLLSGYGLIPLAWSYFAASLISVVIIAVILRKVTSPFRLRLSSAMIRPMINESLPFMFYALFFLIYFKIDFIMLASMKSNALVGEYAVAYRLMESLLFVPAAFMGAVYPSLSRLSTSGRESVLGASKKTVRYMAMIAIPLGFGTTLLAGRLVPFLFGDEYLESVLPLQILIWGLVLIFINAICPVGLNSTNRQRYSMAVVGCGIIINVVLNLLLIPPYGAVGTSISTVATEILTTVLFLWLFHRYIGNLGLFSYLYRPLVASLIMTAVLAAVFFLPQWVLIPAGMAIYFLSLIGLRAFGRSDLEFFNRLLRPAAAGR